jgi:hypothetical protein
MRPGFPMGAYMSITEHLTTGVVRAATTASGTVTIGTPEMVELGIALKSLAAVCTTPDSQQALERVVDYLNKLHRELATQWDENHFEHCGRLPHKDGQPCHWPQPDVLGQSGDSGGTA